MSPTSEDLLRARVASLESERQRFTRALGASAVVATLTGAGVALSLGLYFGAARSAEVEASAGRSIDQSMATVEHLEGQMARYAAGEAECRHQLDSLVCPRTGHLLMNATVTSATGAAHVRVGQPCRVEIDWTNDPDANCRAQVRCGTERLYGDVGQGWLACDVEPRLPVSARDEGATSEDGDARLVLDSEHRRIELSDDAPSWTITLELDGSDSGDDPSDGIDEL